DFHVTGVQTCALPIYPDSVFVEDPAVLTPEFAVIANPGAESRNGEKEAIEEALKKFYDKFYHIEAPGYLDGGDVLQADDHFYIRSEERRVGKERIIDW